MRIIACVSCLVLSACGSATTTEGSGDPSGGDPGGTGGDFVAGGDAGPCGIDCDLAIPNGTGTCDVSSTPARCVVAACDSGFIQLSDTVCAPPPDVSCKPCADDSECYGGTCLNDVCVISCAGSTCPSGYACTDIGGGVERCTPTSGTCSCTAATDGQTRACEVTNGEGTCFGFETCDPASGWVGCDAATPEAEDCDGVDDDCNGLVDDGVTEPGGACEVTNGFGTCTAAWVCSGSAGWTCDAETPVAEECDGLDNDCSGEVDEDFKDGNGYYVDDEHCGACGLTCTGAIANGTAVCVENGGQPRCEVDQCVLGYEEVTPLACLPAAGQLCSDCVTSDDCAVAGDECLPSAEGDYCAQDCSAGNAHGTAAGECPTGFTCTDLGGGVEQCVPDSGVCSCQAINDGETRPCESTNAHGTCVGVETCAVSSGWGGCTAPDPEAEDCDGLDNDCNMLIDDALPAGAACTVSNAYGTCSGTEECAGVSGWLCDAPTPEAETCDHLDNDCDTEIDEDFTNLYDGCSVGTGACERFGFFECNSAGDGTECNAVAGAPGTEVCDDVDNDCMGDVDEDWPTKGDPCRVGTGVCEVAGIFVCNAADPSGSVTCSATPGTPGIEICDGLDNDCMGDIDEDWSTLGDPCVVGTGACEASGVLICDSGDPTGPAVCSATPGTPGTMELCNGIDDDCNGTPDDNPTGAPACAEQDGVCAGSVQRCGGSSGWLACTGNEFGPYWEPVEITCDGRDNDCDGLEDNNLPAYLCVLQNGVCAGSHAPCLGSSGWGACGATEYGSDYEATEATCDGLDNDCNGAIDDGLTGALCPNQQGECMGSRRRCGGTAGWLSCSGADYSSYWEPVEISCDGRDNDCDGNTDAADPDLPAHPCTNQTGVCAGSTAPCLGSGGWGACGAAEYGADYEATEVTCDHLDNDCNGVVDDPFVDTQGSGTHDTDTACGNCYTDCTAIYSGPNATGYCDVSGTPTCRLACDTSDYFDLNGVPNDGCEFHLDANAVYVSVDDPDANNDGSCGNGPVGTGAGNYPCRSIEFALGQVVGSKDKLLVADGMYVESVDVANGVDLLGGFRPDTWERHLSSTATFLRAVDGGADVKAISAVNITSSTTIQGFQVLGVNATTPGANSYGIYVRDSDANLVLDSNVIVAGAGAAGLAGQNGFSGDNGENGSPGGNTENTNCSSSGAFVRAGGAGGAKSCQDPNTFPASIPDTFTTTHGGNGGFSVCPARDFQEGPGIDGGNGGGSGGPGGWGHDSTTAGSCSPTPGELETGTPGDDGVGGSDGFGGNGCSVPFGAVVANEWRADAGSNGGHGSHGAGGGGGGAGGGQRLDSSNNRDLGGSGGGGGSGGCAAERGYGGDAGGGSFGIFVVFSPTNLPTGPADLPEVTNNVISRGLGGAGGSGGFGGAGGSPGSGGSGGLLADYDGPIYCVFPGANGGNGSRGGHGGGGGGGCGGVSFDIAVWNLNGVAQSYAADNVFPIQSTVDTAGVGGAGGLSANPAIGDGTPGDTGGFGNVYVSD